MSWTIICENLICISALSLIYALRFYILISVMTVEILLFAIFLFNIHHRKARDQHVSLAISAVAGLTLFYLVGGIVVLILAILKYQIDISVIILIAFIVVYLVPRIGAFCLAKFSKLAFKSTWTIFELIFAIFLYSAYFHYHINWIQSKTLKFGTY